MALKIDENTIRKIVESTLASMLENPEIEYRTKGSLNKKTLEKQAAATKVEVPSDDDFNPAWSETADDIIQKFKKDDEFDDTTSGGNYKIDRRNPYFINKEGKQVPADAINNFHNDFAIVKKDGKFNFINQNGVILCDDWFDFCNDFEDGFAVVSNNKKRNIVTAAGEYLIPFWVDRAGDFIAGEAPIIFDGELHHIDRNGNIS